MSLGYLTISSVCGAISTPVKIKDLDMYEDWSEIVFCCSNCNLIKQTRDSWRGVYA